MYCSAHVSTNYYTLLVLQYWYLHVLWGSPVPRQALMGKERLGYTVCTYLSLSVTDVTVHACASLLVWNIHVLTIAASKASLSSSLCAWDSFCNSSVAPGNTASRVWERRRVWHFTYHVLYSYRTPGTGISGQCVSHFENAVSMQIIKINSILTRVTRVGWHFLLVNGSSFCSLPAISSWTETNSQLNEVWIV